MVGMSIWDPLSDEELDELEDFLSSDTVPDTTMNLYALDGYLTALAVGPRPQLPDHWLPRVWGEGEYPAFASMEEAQRVMELLLRQLSGIIGQLQEAPEQFEPLLYEHQMEGRSYLIPDEWCRGFMQAVDAASADWAPLLGGPAGDLLVPILMFSTEEGWQRIESASDPDAEHQRWVEQIGTTVGDVYRYWVAHREQRSEAQRRGEHSEQDQSLQRSDLCPCGSGKRFGNCCGAPGRLH